MPSSISVSAGRRCTALGQSRTGRAGHAHPASRRGRQRLSGLLNVTETDATASSRVGPGAGTGDLPGAPGSPCFAISPTPVPDTRDGTGAAQRTLGATSKPSVKVALTGVEPTTSTWLSAYADGSALPAAPPWPWPRPVPTAPADLLGAATAVEPGVGFVPVRKQSGGSLEKITRRTVRTAAPSSR
ncbi:hypothetical protein [Streptomyces canus]|uniref:hypothetical protein n=1 Tax=Streptomyces canus TaxID=58343 RepID=UPI0027D91712|nr:hypothetical protein [Streptomyces canus]